jgi:hypothetical protein
MSRISIDVSDAEHKKLKALAAIQGLSIKEFVLSRTLGDGAPDGIFAELEALLDKRIARAKSEGASKRTSGDIFRRARHGVRRRTDG